MGDTQALIPPPAVIIERLAAASNEVDILRDLLKVSVKMQKERVRRTASQIVILPNAPGKGVASCV